MAHGEGPRPAYAASRAGHRPHIAAIVLNYRTPEATRAALASLCASSRQPDRIVVVDNEARPDGRRFLLDGYGDAVTYLATAENLGFSGGMNVGIRRALRDGADAVAIVNSDAVLAADCLEALERTFDGDRTIGIAGPMLRASRPPHAVVSLGLRYDRRFGRMRDRAADSLVARQGSSPEDVDAVTGCVMLVRREVFGAVGLLDEDYFFSFEDLDFGLSAWQAGYRSVLVREAVAFHEGSRSIGPGSPRRLYYAARNHLRLAARVGPACGRLTAATRTASIVALNAAHAVKASGGTIGQRLAAVWEGTRDYVAGRFGRDAM